MANARRRILNKSRQQQCNRKRQQLFRAYQYRSKDERN